MEDRARTDQQKAEIIMRLGDLWLQNPQMRLTQLIGNVYHIPSGDDPYHVEDYAFIRRMEDFYGEINSQAEGEVSQENADQVGA